MRPVPGRRPLHLSSRRLHNICSMNFRMLRRVAWILCAAPLGLQLVAAAQQTQAPAGAAQTAQTAEFFETKVRPVLAASCYDCHTEMRNGGLRLDSREAMLKGGRSGPAIVPGDPDNSLLIQAIRQTSEKLKMPKGGRLAAGESEALTEWVRAGAVWPAAAPVTTASAAAATSAPAKSSSTYVITPEQRTFWSFQPIHKPAVPAVSH